jgi:hypothetical protein
MKESLFKIYYFIKKHLNVRFRFSILKNHTYTPTFTYINVKQVTREIICGNDKIGLKNQLNIDECMIFYHKKFKFLNVNIN